MTGPAFGQQVAAVREAVTRRLGGDAVRPFSEATATTVRSSVAELLDSGAFDWRPEAGLADRLSEALTGWGPLQCLVDDGAVSDVLVNSWEQVYVERHGELEATTIRFGGEAELRALLSRLAASVGRELSREQPVVDGQLGDGSRFTAVLPPVGGPALCLRRTTTQQLGLCAGAGGQDLVSLQALPEWLAQLLRRALRARCSILISGATGSGKTTFLRALLGCIDPHERVVTIEDTAELALDHPHLLSLQCAAPAAQGAPSWDVAALVETAMRLRPDRLVVGEIRFAREAYQTLEALNTGHPGSVTTIHANGPLDAVRRLEMLVGREFRQLTPVQIRAYVGGVIDLVVHLDHLRGRRKVSSVVALGDVSASGELQWCALYPESSAPETWPARLRQRLDSQAEPG